jgi:adenylate kinase family enzyme
MFPVVGKRKNFFITLGLPGVGKTTFCELLRASCPPGTVKVINRDEIRASLIWEFRKLPPEAQAEEKAEIDDRVTERVINRFSEILHDEPSISVIILDGCHTYYPCLYSLLEAIHGSCGMLNLSFAIHLCMLGSPLSQSAHKLSDKKRDDYSDYRAGGYHTSVPKEVFKMKRIQYFNLICQETFQKVTELCDYVYVLPPYDPTDKENCPCKSQ